CPRPCRVDPDGTAQVELRGQLEKEQAESAGLRAKLEARPVSAADVLDEFLELAREGGKILDENKDGTAWLAKAHEYVRKALRKRHAEDFVKENSSSRPEPDIRMRQTVDASAAWLRGWEGKLTQDNVNPSFTEGGRPADKDAATPPAS